MPYITRVGALSLVATVVTHPPTMELHYKGEDVPISLALFYTLVSYGHRWQVTFFLLHYMTYTCC